jgi:hypothetical protein
MVSCGRREIMGGRIKNKNRDGPFSQSFSFLSHLWQGGRDPPTASAPLVTGVRKEMMEKGGGAFLQQ